MTRNAAPIGQIAILTMLMLTNSSSRILFRRSSSRRRSNSNGEDDALVPTKWTSCHNILDATFERWRNVQC